jgi:hypothetical protein
MTEVLLYMLQGTGQQIFTTSFGSATRNPPPPTIAASPALFSKTSEKSQFRKKIRAIAAAFLGLG